MSKWFIAGAVVASFAAGYALAPREQLDQEVKQTGLFTADTSQVLAATVTSLRKENKLLVYSFAGEVSVKLVRSHFKGALKTKQVLTVPGSVPYYLDLSELGLEDVDYNKEAEVVTVELPKLVMGDVALRAERARTTEDGILTVDNDEVKTLTEKNYAAARKAFTAMAQNREIVNLAEKNAIQNIKDNFEIPLRVVGHPNVKVVARFGKQAT